MLSLVLPAVSIINAVIFPLDQFFSTITAVKEYCLTAKSSFLSSWRLWRRKTGCSALLLLNSRISIFYFTVFAWNTTCLIIFPTCLGHPLMPRQSCTSLPICEPALRNTLKVNSGIETKLSNSQRLPNLCFYQATIWHPHLPLPPHLPQTTSSNIPLSCPHTLWS